MWYSGSCTSWNFWKTTSYVIRWCYSPLTAVITFPESKIMGPNLKLCPIYSSSTLAIMEGTLLHLSVVNASDGLESSESLWPFMFCGVVPAIRWMALTFRLNTCRRWFYSKLMLTHNCVVRFTDSYSQNLFYKDCRCDLHIFIFPTCFRYERFVFLVRRLSSPSAISGGASSPFAGGALVQSRSAKSIKALFRHLWITGVFVPPFVCQSMGAKHSAQMFDNWSSLRKYVSTVYLHTWKKA